MAPIVKVNIIQQVIDYLKDNLENGTWQIGGKIPSENELTKTLEVSRASVRMAIQQLIGIGALESVHGKGTFVVNNNINSLARGFTRITEEDCRDISKVLEFREIVESGICYLAAKNATNENIDNLKKYLEEMRVSAGNIQQFVKADIAFHEEIGKASENQLLGKSLAEVFGQTAKYHQQINSVLGYAGGMHYHTLILEAIIARDAVKARRYMKEHIRNIFRRI